MTRSETFWSFSPVLHLLISCWSLSEQFLVLLWTLFSFHFIVSLFLVLFFGYLLKINKEKNYSNIFGTSPEHKALEPKRKSQEQSREGRPGRSAAPHHRERGKGQSSKKNMRIQWNTRRPRNKETRKKEDKVKTKTPKFKWMLKINDDFYLLEKWIKCKAYNHWRLYSVAIEMWPKQMCYDDSMHELLMILNGVIQWLTNEPLRVNQKR